MLPPLKEQYEKLDEKEKGEVIAKEYIQRLEKILQENGCFDEYR